MSLPNGLTSGNQCFRSGASNTNIYVTKNDPAFEGQLTVSDGSDTAVLDPTFLQVEIDGATARFEIFRPSGDLDISTSLGGIGLSAENGTVSIRNDFSVTNASAELIVDTDGNLTCQALSNISILPNTLAGSGFGLEITNPEANVGVTLLSPHPNATDSQLVIQASPFFQALTIDAGSGADMGPVNSGAINKILATGTGQVSIQFADSACVAGTVWDFIIDPASTATVQFVNTPDGGSTEVIYSFAPDFPPAFTFFTVRIFTPDGSTFFRLVPA